MADWDGFLNLNNSNDGSNEREQYSTTNITRVSNSKIKYSSSASAGSSSSSSSTWSILPTTSPRKIQRANNDITRIPSSSSAPMDIPDWSKIYGKKVSRDDGVGEGRLSQKGNSNSNSNGNSCFGDHYNNNNNNNYENDDEGDDMIPPHEWIAKKLARNQISSFSVCEGIGRTLKGRDLSKVRNAILTKTGFIE